MTVNKKSIPDYKFWSKLNHWSFKEAALLLHGMDPHECMEVKFTTRIVPEAPELKEVYKTFVIFKKMYWDKNYAYAETGASPIEIYFAALEKELDIPEKLGAELKKHIQKEQKNKNLNPKNKNNKNLTTRERRNLLKQIGYMTYVITDCHCSSHQFTVNNRPNAHQITQAILAKAIQLGKETTGLESCNRKIVEALRFVEEEM